MSGWYAKALADVAAIAPDAAGDPIWRPLQHSFGLTAFGANVYVAADTGGELVAAHDERASGQEELYFVVAGVARFTREHHFRDVPRLGDDADPPDPSN